MWRALGYFGSLGWWRLALWLMVVALPSSALDPSRSIHQYGHDQWNRRSGLPGTTVERLFQSPDGYLWLQSAGGLFRFDGVRFVPIPLEQAGVPMGESLRAMGPSRDGGLLLRTASRTLRMIGGRITEAAAPVRLPDGMERVVLETRDGCIWIGTDNHIYRIQNGRLDMVAKGVGWIRDMFEDHQGDVWISASSALYRCHQGRLMPLLSTQNGAARTFLPLETPPEGLRNVVFPKMPTALLEDRNNVMWIGTLGGMKKWKGGRLLQDADTARFGDSSITALCLDRDGNLWVGTDGQGLFRLSRGQWSRLGSAEGLSDNSVLSLREDQEGGLWIGTCNGLDQLRDVPVRTITSRDGLSDDNICTVMEGPDGGLYTFALGGSIARLKDEAIKVFTSRDGLVNSYSGCLFVSRDGTLWAGSGRGLSALRKGKWQTYTDGGRLLKLFISAIEEDDESLILACSDLNLYRFRDGQLRPYNLRMSRPEDVRYVFSMLRDGDGTLWFGSSAGLYRLDHGQPPEKAMATAFKDPAVSLYDDGLGYLWITGRDTPGFTRLNKRDGSLVRYTPEAGAVGGGIGRILSDQANNLWMNTKIGIVTFSRMELDAFATGQTKILNPTIYDSIDGLRTDDCSGNEKQPSAWRTRGGELAFSSPRGLVLIDPARIPRNRRPPPIHIEELLLDNMIQPMDKPLVFEPGQKDLEIRFSATSLQVPSRVRFKYKLEGYDPNWIEAGTRRTAFYTKMPPGSFIFRVMAANNDGVWNQEGASVRIWKRPHFYQTAWFRVLAVVAILGCVAGLYWFRVRMHIRAEKELQARINAALAHIHALQGLLPICAWCKRIRDDAGDWRQIEAYIADHSQAEFSHGICPECKKDLLLHPEKIAPSAEP